MKFAATDIGSNAVRLLLAGVIEDGNPPVFNMGQDRTNLCTRNWSDGRPHFISCTRIIKARTLSIIQLVLGE